MAYYSGNIFTAPSCPPCPDNKICADGKGCARCIVGPDTFDLTGGILTIYALKVNMTQSRVPTPSCPYNGWPPPLTSSVIELGATNRVFAGMLNPVNSA